MLYSINIIQWSPVFEISINFIKYHIHTHTYTHTIVTSLTNGMQPSLIWSATLYSNMEKKVKNTVKFPKEPLQIRNLRSIFKSDKQLGTFQANHIWLKHV